MEMLLANKRDKRSNVFSCDRYCVYAAYAMISIFAETLSICAAGVPFAFAPSLRRIFEISSLWNPWRVTAGRCLLAT
jgi:hypothetical protein